MCMKFCFRHDYCTSTLSAAAPAAGSACGQAVQHSSGPRSYPVTNDHNYGHCQDVKTSNYSMTFIAPENGQYLLWTWPKKNYGRWKIPVIGGDNSVRVWIQIDFMLDSGSWDWILHEARESLIKRADRLSSSSVWNKETHFKISGESSSQNVQARIILGNKWAGLLSYVSVITTLRG